MNRTAAFFLALLTMGAAQGSSALAQAMGQYQARPTLSPWMNLFQRNAGPVDNYHTYVRPQMQLRDTLHQQNMQLQQQTAGLEAVGQQITELQQPQPVARPTGTGSVFMDYSHYYDMRRAATNPRTRPVR
jgi:hypothetical protein